MIVTTPEVAAIRDADRIIGLMESRQIGRMDLIVNRLRFDMIRNGEMMSLEDIRDILSINIIGAVPDDENVVGFHQSGRTPCRPEYHGRTGLRKYMYAADG